MNNKINSILSNNDNNNNSNNNNDNNNNDSTNKNINKNKKDFFINKKYNTKEFDCKKSILGKYFSSGWTVSKLLEEIKHKIIKKGNISFFFFFLWISV